MCQEILRFMITRGSKTVHGLRRTCPEHRQKVRVDTGCPRCRWNFVKEGEDIFIVSPNKKNNKGKPRYIKFSPPKK